MEKPLTSFDDMFPKEWLAEPFGAFEPCARYHASMDCVIYLNEDLSYRADRVDQFLTILWHPEMELAVGIKLKGFRFLFERIQTVQRTLGHELPESAFLPLITAVEMALTVNFGSDLTKQVQGGRIAEQQRLTECYCQARLVIGNVNVSMAQINAA
jgi:hypothetical protein